jgi:predicted acyltransferase
MLLNNFKKDFSPKTTEKSRIISLDVFRGLLVAGMIFVNSIGFWKVTPYLLKHAPWNGLTFADLIFPLFLFAVGVSMAYSFQHRAKQPERYVVGHMLFRVSVIFCIGLFINLIIYGWPLRIPGVLQLIALSSLLAFPFGRLEIKWIILGAIIFLSIQSTILLFISAPGIPAGMLGLHSNIAGWIDVQILGSQHLYSQTFDPEGTLSIIAGSSLVLFGLATGKMLQIDEISKIRVLIFGGLLAILMGILLSFWLPVNKHLWTATFILITTGFGLISLTTLYTYLDIKRKNSFMKIAVPLGRNALFIYIGSEILTAILIAKIFTSNLNFESMYQIIGNFFMTAIEPLFGVITLSTLILLFWWIIAAFLYKKKIYIKI